MKNKIKLLLVCIGLLAAGICYLTSYGTKGAQVIVPSGLQEDGTAESFAAAFQTAAEAERIAEASQAAADAFRAAVEDSGTAAGSAAGVGSATTAGSAAGAGSDAAGAEETAARIVVHVCGEVAVPGVYELEAGSRIYQAVEKAGGCTEDAAADFLNMAQVLQDGMKLEVPDREEAARRREQPGYQAVSGGDPSGLSGGMNGGTGGGTDGGAGGTVNINTASKEELMTLKGIGEARAEDIISYRQEHGPFNKIEDIMKVSGIKEAAFQKIREKIAV